MSELLKFYFPSHLKYLDLAHHLTERIIEELTTDEDVRYHLTLVVSEAVTNAIVHGNQNDVSKDLILCFSYDQDKLKIEVEDQGKGKGQGFDPEKIKSQLEKEKLHRDSGRGIFLVQAFMDKVRFLAKASGGTKVEMIKYLKNLKSKNEKMLALREKSSYNNH